MADGLWSALAKRYPAPQWAYFTEVRNGTGYRHARTADAMALGLWPSMGMELHGVEVKASRSDWKRELEQPEKSEELGKYCDRWWLCSEEKVVLDIGEIPPAWGWLEFSGGKLKTRKPAPKREAKALDRHFVASVLRDAHERSARQIEDRAHQLNKERDEAKVEKAAEKLRAEIQALADANSTVDRQKALLRRIGAALGIDEYGRGGRPQFHEQTDLTDEQLAKLHAVAGVDLAEARAQMSEAVRQLRMAADSARLLLRSHGFKAERRRRYGW